MQPAPKPVRLSFTSFQRSLFATLFVLATGAVRAQSLSPSSADREQQSVAAEMARLDRRFDQLKSQLESFKGESAALNTKAQELMAAGQILRSQDQQLQGEVQSFQSRQQALEQEASHIEAQRHQVDRSDHHEVNRFNAHVDEHNRKLHELESVRRAIHDKFREIQAARARLHAEASAGQRQQESLERKRDDLNREAIKLRDDRNDLERRAAAIQPSKQRSGGNAGRQNRFDRFTIPNQPRPQPDYGARKDAQKAEQEKKMLERLWPSKTWKP
jgi:chromosome segregation ATPase